MISRLLWIVWFAMLTAIAVGSLLPSFGPTNRYDFDKFVHLGAYMALAFWPALALQRRTTLLLFVAGLLLASGLIEWLQGGIAGRQSSLTDFAANMLGVMTGTFAARLLRRQGQFLAFLQREPDKNGVLPQD